MVNFIRYQFVYFLLSGAAILTGLVALGLWGLKPAVDFTGGTLLQIELPDESQQDQLRALFTEKEIKILSVQQSGTSSLIRTPSLSQESLTELKEAIPQVASGAATLREETVGPTLGRELLLKTLAAVFLASVIIIIYVAFRFKSFKYGLCAVLAMFHDTAILVGSFAILGHFFAVEVDTLFVTAVLTLLSFSAHDTIVVYDRIREVSRKNPTTPYPKVVNLAINETLIRSVNNSLTIVFMLLALVLLGGESIRWFIVALLIGTVSGTYSSTFTAAPLLVVWDNLSHRLRR